MMSASHRIRTIILLSCLLLTACGQTQPLPATATAQPTAMLRPTRMAATTATFTVTPTITPLPDTATPTIEITATIDVYSEADIPAVLEGLATSLGWGGSPGKDWYWAYGRGKLLDPSGFPEAFALVFRRADGKVEWNITPTLDDLYGVTGVDVMFHPLFWSPEEPYVYLGLEGYHYGPPVNAPYVKDFPAIDMMFNYRAFAAYQTLVRLNLQTGKLERQVTGPGFYYFLFAPDGEYYLQVPVATPQLRIHSLLDGQETVIHLPDAWRFNGNGSFSPDQKRILVQSCEYQEMQGCARTPLLLVDVETGAYDVVLADLIKPLGEPAGSGEAFAPIITWIDETRIRMVMRDSENVEHEWIFNLTTKVLKQTSQ